VAYATSEPQNITLEAHPRTSAITQSPTRKLIDDLVFGNRQARGEPFDDDGK
jgi:hypothetical protein